GRKRPNVARLFDGVFSFHFGFSAALENLRWVQNISRTKPGVNGGRFTSRPGGAAAFRRGRLAVDIDWTRGRSRAGSRFLLARKPHANSRNIRRNCVERSAVKGEKGLRKRRRRAFGISTDVRNRAMQAFWAMHVGR